MIINLKIQFHQIYFSKLLFFPEGFIFNFSNFGKITGDNRILYFQGQQYNSEMIKNFQDPHYLHEFIKSQSYKKDADFNRNSKNLLRLIQYLEELAVEDSSFPIIQGLLKFYGFPLFICLKKFFQKLQKMKNFESEDEVKDIAAFVKKYLGQIKLEELTFFFCMGTSKKKFNMNERSKQQKQFIDYVAKLSKHLTELKHNSHKLNSKNLKREIEALLAQGIQRKLNTLQLEYENYFKRQADKIYRQNKKKIEQDEQSQQYEPINKGIQMKPQFKDERQDLMCCRTFFYDGEIIKEPQNLVLQYKNYSFPFDQKRIGILKKTLCAFLNTNGGIIFIGIHEHIQTKKRTVRGLILNESEQENFLKQIRKIAQNIEPSIIGNKLYEVKFVPIKKNNHPYNYISGKFVAKIIINYGIRDDIYSYSERETDMYSFRTENQVIHRAGRQILNILRERIKNPLPIPDPPHPGPCKNPQIGSRIYDDQKSRNKIRSEHKKQNNNNHYSNNYKNNDISYEKKEKIKYKEKDAMDYLVIGMNEVQLQGIINNNELKEYIRLNKSQRDICFLKVKDKAHRQKIQILAAVLQSEDVRFEAIERGIQLQNVQGYEKDIVYETMEAKKVKYSQEGGLFKFKSAEDAIQAFLVIEGFGFSAEFVPI